MAKRKQVMRRQLQQVDVLLAPSRFLAAVHAAVIDGLPLRAQAHGHDLNWLTNSSDKTRPTDRIRFCYMGQIIPDKGVHVLVDAFLRLNPASEAELDIWGGLDDSTYVASIRKLAAQSEKIHLRGRFVRAQLAAVLVEADIVVAPSIWYENSPLVIHEAFAAGVPVVATDLGGMAEFVQHEVNGLLFARADADSLAEQMERIIREPTLLARLRAGIPAVKTIQQEVIEVLAIYEQLVGRCAGA
jgi:glycosyltransferase involved in cell wall biosynthesis